MLAYIFDNAVEAVALVAAIDLTLGLPKPGCVSTTYDFPRAHPTDGRWSVLSGAGGVNTEGMRAADQLPLGVPAPAELTEDWWPTP